MSAAQCVSCSKQDKLPHYVHLDGTGCTHLVVLYWLMVFIHETHVMPSSGKVKTKRLFSYLVLTEELSWPSATLPLQLRSMRSLPMSGNVWMRDKREWRCAHVRKLKWRKKPMALQTNFSFNIDVAKDFVVITLQGLWTSLSGRPKMNNDIAIIQQYKDHLY